MLSTVIVEGRPRPGFETWDAARRSTVRPRGGMLMPRAARYGLPTGDRSGSGAERRHAFRCSARRASTAGDGSSCRNRGQSPTSGSVGRGWWAPTPRKTRWRPGCARSHQRDRRACGSRSLAPRVLRPPDGGEADDGLRGHPPDAEMGADRRAAERRAGLAVYALAALHGLGTPTRPGARRTGGETHGRTSAETCRESGGIRTGATSHVTPATTRELG
jgi:hypothetical protein